MNSWVYIERITQRITQNKGDNTESLTISPIPGHVRALEEEYKRIGTLLRDKRKIQHRAIQRPGNTHVR